MGLEAEVRAFWKIARDIRLTEAAGAAAVEARDDLDVIRLYTDHPGIKARAAILLADDPAEAAVAGLK